MIFDQNRGAERSWGKIDRRRRPPSLPSKDFVLLTRASSEPFEALYSDRLLAWPPSYRGTGCCLYAHSTPRPPGRCSTSEQALGCITAQIVEVNVKFPRNS